MSTLSKKLNYVFMASNDFRKGVLSYLSPVENALLFALANVELSVKEKSIYLRVEDELPTLKLNDGEFEEGEIDYLYAIYGTGLSILQDVINNPILLLAKEQTVVPICIEYFKQTKFTLERSCSHYFQSCLEYDTPGIGFTAVFAGVPQTQKHCRNLQIQNNSIFTCSAGEPSKEWDANDWMPVKWKSVKFTKSCGITFKLLYEGGRTYSEDCRVNSKVFSDIISYDISKEKYYISVCSCFFGQKEIKKHYQTKSGDSRVFNYTLDGYIMANADDSKNRPLEFIYGIPEELIRTMLNIAT